MKSYITLINLLIVYNNLFEVTGLTSSDETQKDIAYILKIVKLILKNKTNINFFLSIIFKYILHKKLLILL